MLKPPVPSFNGIIPLLQSHQTRSRFHDAQNQVQPQMAYVAQRGQNKKKVNTSSIQRDVALFQGNDLIMVKGVVSSMQEVNTKETTPFKDMDIVVLTQRRRKCAKFVARRITQLWSVLIVSITSSNKRISHKHWQL